MAASGWRRQRLLVLCYHGISRFDEHQWRPLSYMQVQLFRRRLEILKRGRYNVLPLGKAIERLQNADLPPRAVALTFDDGGYDFYTSAFPVIRKFEFPVTVYQTTYHSEFQRPIFNLACSYMLWKRRGDFVKIGREFGLDERLDLTTESSRAKIVRALVLKAESENLTGWQKDKLAAGLARQLDVSYEEIIVRRMFHLMNGSEISELAAAGVDFQLHTHRHRTPIDENQFRREIEDNRRSLRDMGPRAIHFCYPSGIYRKEFLPWLRAEEIVSATTCDAGIASRQSQALLLPRLVDTSAASEIEFEARLAGLPYLLRGTRASRQVVPAAAGRASQVEH